MLGKNPSIEDFLDEIRKLHFRDIEQDISDGKTVSAQRIVDRVKSRGNVPIPSAVMDLLCDHALRKVPTKMGKPARDPLEVELRDLRIKNFYQGIFDRLSGASSQPLPVEFLEQYDDVLSSTSMTPGEKAAEIVSRFFASENISARRVQNIAYARK